jgi:hypothetical protein
MCCEHVIGGSSPANISSLSALQCSSSAQALQQGCRPRCSMPKLTTNGSAANAPPQVPESAVFTSASSSLARKTGGRFIACS